MDKCIEKEVTRTEYEHEFYCDKCNKYLGKSQEYEDGYYAEIGKVDVKLYGLELSGNFCDDCKKELGTQIREALIKIGFKKPNNGD